MELTPEELIARKNSFIGGEAYFREGGIGSTVGILSDISLSDGILWFTISRATEKVNGYPDMKYADKTQISIMAGNPTSISEDRESKTISVYNYLWGDLSLSPN